MEITALKSELHDKIEHADPGQLTEIYELITEYLNKQERTEEWDLLPEVQRQLIIKSLEQADAGLGVPFDEVTKLLKDKYRLDN